MLHNTGIVVWHNVAKLRDLVVLDAQWLANAMASVVTFMGQDSISSDGGMANWFKIREFMKIRYDLSSVVLKVNIILGSPNWTTN